MNDRIEKIKIGILGLGRVGAVLARRFREKGCNLHVVWDISRDRIRAFHEDSENVVAASGRLFLKCGIVFVCVPDRQILPAVQAFLNKGWFNSATLVVHTGGMMGPEILADVSDRIAGCGAMHPYMSFPAEPENAMAFDGVGFGITASEDIAETLEKIVQRIGGIPVRIPAEKRTLYHLAAVISSNFSVFLEIVADDILRQTGLDRETAGLLVGRLMDSTRHNLTHTDALSALSGPVIRRDWDTIFRHIQALEENLPEFVSLYREIATAMSLYCHNIWLPSIDKSAKVTHGKFSSEDIP